jgi:hypothetical protein
MFNENQIQRERLWVQNYVLAVWHIAAHTGTDRHKWAHCGTGLKPNVDQNKTLPERMDAFRPRF